MIYKYVGCISFTGERMYRGENQDYIYIRRNGFQHTHHAMQGTYFPSVLKGTSLGILSINKRVMVKDMDEIT